MDIWVVRFLDGWIFGVVDGRTDGWMYGWLASGLDGWIDG